MTETEINNLSKKIVGYRAHKALWGAVIIQAVQDARNSILNSKNFERALKIEMLYFNSTGFEKVCDLAGLKIDSKTIENCLRRLCDFKQKGARKCRA